MGKKPWELKIFETKKDVGEQTSRKDKHSGFLSTPLLTGLLSVFFLIVVGILIVVFYTSNGGSDETKATSGFYRSSQSISKEVKSSQGKSEKKNKTSTSKKDKKKEASTESSTKVSTQESSSTSSSSEVNTEEKTPSTTNGQTIVVQAGAIAARAGISIEQLQALNPQNMTLGYWYANPGDVVHVN